MKEIWKDIKRYEGLYQISNYGRIKSRYKSAGRIKGKEINDNYKILKLSDNNGYRRCCLTKNKKEYRCSVHRLVALTFIPNPENKPCVNHIDFNRANNNVDNLEWVTYGENIKHDFNHNVKTKKGQYNSMSKLEEKDVVFIRKNRLNYLSDELADMFNVSRACINDILAYRRWRHI